MTTNHLIQSAISRVSAAYELSDVAQVTFAVNEIEPVLQYLADQARMIELLKEELRKIQRKSEDSIDMIFALEKRAEKAL